MSNCVVDPEELIIRVQEYGVTHESTQREWEACYKGKRDALHERFVERVKELSTQPGTTPRAAYERAVKEIDEEARREAHKEMALRASGYCHLFLKRDVANKRVSVGYADLIDHYVSGRRYLERNCTLGDFTSEELKDIVRTGVLTVLDAGERVRRFGNFNPGFFLGQLAAIGK